MTFYKKLQSIHNLMISIYEADQLAQKKLVAKSPLIVDSQPFLVKVHSSSKVSVFL